MLQSLHIRDFVIVNKLDISFESGFTVFSGETGAGKSILIDALSLCLGGRAESFSIREGADKTEITAVFDRPASLKTWCEEQDINDEELVIRRTFDLKGKSRAWINGIPSTLSQLKEIGEHLVDIHGQHAHQNLLKPTEQRVMIDVAHKDLSKSVSQAYQIWQTALKTLEKATAEQALRSEERDRLEWQLSELKKLKLQKGQWEALNESHSRLSNAAQLIDLSSSTLNLIDGEQNSVLHLLTQACRHLQSLSKIDSSIEPIFNTIESARIECQEASSDLNHYLNNIDIDPDTLAEMESKISAIFSASKRFHCSPETLYLKVIEIEQSLETLEKMADLEALEKEAKEAEQHYLKQAATLTQARKKVAQKLSKAVTTAMQDLAMKGGRFDVQLSPTEPSQHGVESVEFLVAGHAGTTPRALHKIASGGELARISLALSVMASQAERVPTLIFDEVDSGIGGAVADIVGKLLHDLGQKHQVLCVTHLPQVASYGDHHFLVEKQSEKDKTISRITLMNQDERIREIARMLGSATITDTTLKHAREMLGH
ncbi:DNA repair protein RecN [Basilea psittacipulmonis]|uniref:DNA repair protein RecN n=1 Tax=Basilea psittacipulmonis DSM 24701 TaxID=1072685 RepID=A0A077DFR9_9BURK|nr:DNA repair protein RecN [Basilea psittacipulmonis]AIL32202.1 DNA repair protein [Basilea psittacipulmonis DSM 24701]